MDIDYKEDLKKLNDFYKKGKNENSNGAGKFLDNEFGDNYIDRNKRDHLYPSKMSLFSDIVKNISTVKSLLSSEPTWELIY